MLKNLWNKYSSVGILILWLVAIGIRWYGIVYVPAQYYDIATYEAWGHMLIGKGIAEFFATSWTDYLPLPIYFCSLLVHVNDILHMNYGVLFKIAVSAIEIGLLTAIWSSLTSPKKWLLLPLLIISPALMGDSAYWGQLDTIPSLLTVLSLILLTSAPLTKYSVKSLGLPAIIFGLAVAFKPIVLITLPVLLVVLLSHAEFSVKKFLQLVVVFGAISFGVFITPAFPVSSNPLKFVYEKSVEQASTYPYTTINGWNIWSVTDLNNTWPPDNQSVFGITAHTAGLGMFGIYALLVARLWHKDKWSPSFALRAAGTLLVGFYVLTTRMHERHLFFGLPFLAIAALSESWLIIPTLVLTATFTLNLWGAYEWVNHGQTWPVTASFIQIVSWINVVTAAALVLVGKGKIWWKSLYEKLLRNYPLVIILSLAVVLRVSGLSYPKDYIFDEVYHSFTAREYIHNNIEAWEWWTSPPPGVAFEWTHPPVAKYGMVLGMLLFGENAVGWRIASSVMGALCILGIYRLTYSLFGKKSIALLAALLVTIEGLHVSQSRVGMNDMYMLCFLVWSLWNAVKGRWKVSAILYGLALGSKWSAMYGVIPLAFIYFHDEIWHKKVSIIKQLFSIVRIVLISGIVYVLTFTPFLTAGHTWAQWWELHRQMWYYHTHLVATHAYQSTPWQWFFSLRPVWYFVDYGEKVANIYAQGNPVVLWLGLVGLLAMVPYILCYSYTVIYIVFAIFSLPWLISPRIMFFYHYLPSATFLTILLAAWLDSLPKKIAVGLVLICGIAFILMSPVYYGFPMPKEYWDTMFKIFPSWK